MRHFRITCALRHGYNADATTHSVEFAESTIHSWMRERCESDQPFLTGFLTSGKVIYTWKDAGEDDAPESTVVFSGEISVAYNADMSDAEATEILNDLASYMGEHLNQTRVYVAYRDMTWILEAEDKTSPRKK